VCPRALNDAGHLHHRSQRPRVIRRLRRSHRPASHRLRRCRHRGPYAPCDACLRYQQNRRQCMEKSPPDRQKACQRGDGVAQRMSQQGPLRRALRKQRTQSTWVSPTRGYCVSRDNAKATLLQRLITRTPAAKTTPSGSTPRRERRGSYSTVALAGVQARTTSGGMPAGDSSQYKRWPLPSAQPQGSSDDPASPPGCSRHSRYAQKATTAGLGSNPRGREALCLGTHLSSGHEWSFLRARPNTISAEPSRSCNAATATCGVSITTGV
jgi:hypothetical protein